MRLLCPLLGVVHALYSPCPPGTVLRTPYENSPQYMQDVMNSLTDQLQNMIQDELKDAAGDIPVIGPLVDGYENLEFLRDTYNNCRATGSSNCLAFAAFCYGLKQVQDMTIGIIPLKKILPPFDKWCKGEPVLKCCAVIGQHGCHSAFNDDAPINCEGNPAYGPTWTPGICVPTNRYPGDPGCLCDYLPACVAVGPGQGQCSSPSSPLGRRLLQTPSYCGSLNSFVAYPLSGLPKLNQTFNGTYSLIFNGEYLPEGSAVVTSAKFGPFQTYINPFATNTTFRTINSPDINALRRSMFVRDLRKQFLPTLLGMMADPDMAGPVKDFLSFRGCKGFAKGINPRLWSVLKDRAAFLQDIPYYTYTIYNGAAVRNDTFSRSVDLFRRTVDFSIGRVIASLPYFWARFDFASSFEWSQEDKVSYFRTLPTSPLERGTTTYLRAEAALLPLLGPVGLAILQSSRVVDWELFAPPLPVSSPGWGPRWLGDEEEWHLQGKSALAGCELGDSPLLSVVVSERLVAGEKRAVVNLTFTDPENFHGLRVPIKVSWGDGTFSRAYFVEPSIGFRMTTSLSHKFMRTGSGALSPVLITASIVNGAGLVARASALYTPTAEAVTTAAVPVEAQLQTSEARTFYTMEGFLPLTAADLPASFRLRAACGRFFGASGNLLGPSSIGVSISVDSPEDFYNASGVGELCRINANGSYVNSQAALLVLGSFVPSSVNFAWQFFLKTGTSDQVIVWNPLPDGGFGSYISDDGTRFRLDSAPSLFTVIDAAFTPPVNNNNWILRGTQLLGSVTSLRVNVRVNSDARSELSPLPTQFEVLRSPTDELKPDGRVAVSDEPVTLTPLALSPSYSLPGFRLLAKEVLPSNFKLTSTCGACWSSVAGMIYEGAYSIRFTAESATGPVGSYRLRANTLYLRANARNSNLLELSILNTTNTEFSWQLFLKDNTNDQVILWNPLSSPTGSYVVSDGSRPRVSVNSASTPPLIFTLSKGPLQTRPKFHPASAFTFQTAAANFSLAGTSVETDTSFAVDGAPSGLRLQCRSPSAYIYTLPWITVLSLDFFVGNSWVTIPGGEFTSLVYTLNNSDSSRTRAHTLTRGSASVYCARRGNVFEDDGAVLELYFQRQSLITHLARLLPPSSWDTGTPSAETEVRPGVFVPVTATLPVGSPCSFASQCVAQECLVNHEPLRAAEDPYGCSDSPTGTCSVEIYTGAATTSEASLLALSSLVAWCLLY